MKKLLLLISFVAFLGCGVGNYSLSSGKEDKALISFTSTEKQELTVFVDGNEYNVESVKDKKYKTDRKIKQTTLNAIAIEPGQHEIEVLLNGNSVYKKKLIISSTEHRVIEL